MLAGAITLAGISGPLLADLTAPLRIADVGDTVDVPRGSTLVRVAAELEGRGILERRSQLVMAGRVTRLADRIKAGEYDIRPGDTTISLLRRIAAGETVRHTITLVEGWSFRQIRTALKAEARLAQTLQAADDADVMRLLGRDGEHPEGRFFPDTYVFARGQGDIDILRRAMSAMDRVLAAEWAGREPELPYDSAYEALTMASIVEKETGAAHERAQIAGVFVRRLRKGMKLQTDPTVIYGMGERFDGDIRRKDLREATPYNTYVISGLPPTPIASPGQAAIHAALHPKPGTSLYFVARSDGSGTHYFSDTYAEHKRAVRRYQLGKK